MVRHRGRALLQRAWAVGQAHVGQGGVGHPTVHGLGPLILLQPQRGSHDAVNQSQPASSGLNARSGCCRGFAVQPERAGSVTSSRSGDDGPPSGPSRSAAAPAVPVQRWKGVGRGAAPRTPATPAPAAPPLTLQPQGGSGQLSDLALANAPSRLLQLIGDPRTGVADDVTDNPFGSVTVDMVHHQQSNEVYWFKYEIAADQLSASHRDGRLSDYSRNLMYLLRARDPSRWTIDALAHKFRIRPQRVLAILALKEMESQAIETGEAMQGPLSAYAVRVHVQDLLLDGSGDPAEPGSPVLVSAAADAVAAARDAAAAPQSVLELGSLPRSATAAGAGGAAAVNPGTLPLPCALPRTQLVASRVQQRLAQLLGSFKWDLGAARDSVLGGVDAALEAVRAHVPTSGPSSPADGSGEAVQQQGAPALAALRHTAAAAQQLLSALETQRGAVAAVFDALDDALLQAAPRGDAGAKDADAGTQTAVPAAPGPRRWRSGVLEHERTVMVATQSLSRLLGSGAGLGDGGPSGATAPAGGSSGSLAGRLEAVIDGLDDAGLMAAMTGLTAAQRTALVAATPTAGARLSVAGADLPSLKARKSGGSSRASGGRADANRPALDVLGYEHLSDQQYRRVMDTLDAAVGAQAAVDAAMAAFTGGPAASSSAGGADHAWLRALLGTRTGFEATLAAVQEQRGGQLRDGVSALEALQIMHEADPGALERVTMVEAARQLEAAGDAGTASQVRAKLCAQTGAAASAAATPAAATTGLQDTDGLGDRTLGAAAAADRGAWDCLAAWLEAGPGGRRFHRGSGERQVARLPTYPAFEGQPVEAVDGVEEGALSSLNRRLGEAQQGELAARFSRDLLYNLGLLGPGLWDGSRARSAPNLDAAPDVAPLVVYDILADGRTVYPPLYVVETDGTRRPLNEQELAWQERRKRERIPYRRAVHYTMQRIRRKPELL